jgi:hypothetical protein
VGWRRPTVAGGDDVGARWVVTGARAGAGGTGNQLERSKAVWAADRCAWPSKHFFPNFQIHSKLCNSIQMSSRGSKIFMLCMVLYLSILNNFSHCPNFKIPLDFKLQILGQIQI